MQWTKEGIASDICGQLLFELANRIEGTFLRKRVANLWQEIQSLYKEYGVEYRLATLTPEVLGQGKKSKGKPCLKGPAAHVRHLVPLLPILIAKYMSGGNDHDKACHKLSRLPWKLTPWESWQSGARRWLASTWPWKRKLCNTMQTAWTGE